MPAVITEAEDTGVCPSDNCERLPLFISSEGVGPWAEEVVELMSVMGAEVASFDLFAAAAAEVSAEAVAAEVSAAEAVRFRRVVRRVGRLMTGRAGASSINPEGKVLPVGPLNSWSDI